jgi:hypothetical protein
MADTDEIARDLRMRVQVAWENAMDNFFERLDDIVAGSTEVQDSDMVSAVHRQIDEDTADAYQEWIEG